MQQRVLVSGFSELKDLLIRTFQIDRDRALVKLYFTEKGIELLMHDYSDYKKTITLSRNMGKKDIRIELTADAHKLIEESLRHPRPSDFLNEGFTLNGFFSS